MYPHRQSMTQKVKPAHLCLPILCMCMFTLSCSLVCGHTALGKHRVGSPKTGGAFAPTTGSRSLTVAGSRTSCLHDMCHADICRATSPLSKCHIQLGSEQLAKFCQLFRACMALPYGITQRLFSLGQMCKSAAPAPQRVGPARAWVIS